MLWKEVKRYPSYLKRKFQPTLLAHRHYQQLILFAKKKKIVIHYRFHWICDWHALTEIDWYAWTSWELQLIFVTLILFQPLGSQKTWINLCLCGRKWWIPFQKQLCIQWLRQQYIHNWHNRNKQWWFNSRIWWALCRDHGSDLQQRQLWGLW